MNKLILGTAAVALFTAPALAAPISVSVGGYYNAVFYDVDVDENQLANARSSSIHNDNEIIFKGKTKSDSGIEFGFQVQLEGEGAGASDHIDENYVYVKGDFGKIEMGAENNAAYKMQVSAPKFLGWKTYDNNFKTWGEVSSFDKPLLDGVDGDALKVNYYTPKVNGFQLGISYTPDTSDTSGDSGLYAEGDAGTATAYAVSYAGTVAGMKVKASYGVNEFDEDPGVDPREDTALGLSVAFGDWTVGGASTTFEKNNVDTDILHYGVQYQLNSSTTIGFAIHDQEIDSGNDTEILAIGGATKLASGVLLTYSHETVEETVAGSASYDSDFTGVGLLLKF